MTFLALAFAAGAALLQVQAALPPLAGAWLLVPLCMAALRFRPVGIAAAFAAGFFWAAACAQWRMNERLAPGLEGRDLAVVGVVTGLPASGERGIRFDFEVESSEAPLPKKIVLSGVYFESREKDTLLAGERLAVDISLFKLLSNELEINSIDLEGIGERWMVDRTVPSTI